MGADNKMERRHATLTPKRKAAFLDALRGGFSVSYASRLVRLSRVTMYKHRAADEGFEAEWDAAVEEGTDLLEDEARRRATDGVPEPIFYQGQQITQVQRYSDNLLMFLLKGRRPAKFRDNVDVTSGGEKIKAPMVFLPKVADDPED